jgi:glycosyltransferase 2 family protein
MISLDTMIMANKQSLLRQWLLPFVKLLLAALLIFWLVKSGRFDLDSLAKISSPIIWFLGVLLFFVVAAVNSYRWLLLLKLENVEISFLKSFKLSLIGIFFNFFMPGGVGGDVIKGGYLIREESNKDKKWFIGWSLFVDRVFGMLALLVYSSIAGLLFHNHLQEPLNFSFYSLSLLIFIGFISLILIIVFIPKKKINYYLSSHPLTHKTLLPLFFFIERPKSLPIPFLLSLLSQGVVISMGILLALELQVDLPLWTILLVFPFGFLATVVPLSPAGIGVGQAAFFYLFDKVAGQGEFGVLAITFFQVVQFLVGLFGGLLFVLYNKKRD